MNHAVLRLLDPEQVQVEICRADELDQRRGLSSELDEMWAYVTRKWNPRWLWHAIDHLTGKVLAYVFGRRKDEVFLQLKRLLEPFGITRYYTDGWALMSAISMPAAPGWQRRTQKSRASTSGYGRESTLGAPYDAFPRRTHHDLVIGLFINRYEFGLLL